MKLNRKNFSLIELLVVIGIMGALTVLILPSFGDAETVAKDNTCDFNNAGTLRYISQFRSVNGAFPSGMHTGLASATAGTGKDSGVAGLAANTKSNMENKCITRVMTAPEAKAMTDAGFKELGYGELSARTLAAPAATNFVAFVSAEWEEEPGSGEAITYGGQNYTQLTDATTGEYASMFPLYVTPLVNWKKAFGPNGADGKDSLIGLDLEGKCPWLKDGEFRYYICMFGLTKGTEPKVELIGTLCPECGPLQP